MVDVSDGLAADLHHICEESHCGALLRAEAIPIHADAYRLGDNRSPLEHALSDGEDFELVFAVSSDDGQKLLASQPVTGIDLTHIGECVDTGLWLEEKQKRKELQPAGYTHFLG